MSLESLKIFKNNQTCLIWKIVYKKTAEWYIEWQQVTTSGTTSEN